MAGRVQSFAGFGAGVAVVAIVASLAWSMWPAPGGAQDKVPSTPVPSAGTGPTAEPAVPMAVAAPAAAVPEAAPPVTASPLDGLKIASQSWRRGGLGSKALITFTLRNANGYAVKDIEVACAFARRDGSHLTDRRRLMPQAVAMKSRKTFSRVHFGFVNVNAEKAKCALVGASRA